jgi:ferric-dicitrate binding protein FerR (iron transport regulator)
METDRPNLENLFLKKINGDLTPDERRYLDERLNTSDLDRIEYDKIQRLWNATSKLPLHKGAPPTERWSTLRQNMRQLEGAKSIPFYRTTWRYAAAIALLAVLIGVYFFSNSSEPISVQTNHGETKSITLPDHSTAILNAGSSLTYDEATWDDQRKIELVGEAFFDVKKNGVPFSVVTKNSSVKVLGTSFNVRARDESTEVVCLTGKVNFGSRESGESVILMRGDGARIEKDTMSKIFRVAVDDTIPWVTGDLVFNNTPLKEVFAEVERHFAVSVTIKRDLGTLTFTGKFKQPRLNNVIESVCLSAGLEYSITNNSVIIQ